MGRCSLGRAARVAFMHNNQNNQNNQKRKKTQSLASTDTADLRGRERDAFFAAGGTAKQWGLLAGAGVIADAKKEASRRAARGRRHSED